MIKTHDFLQEHNNLLTITEFAKIKCKNIKIENISENN